MKLHHKINVQLYGHTGTNNQQTQITYIQAPTGTYAHIMQYMRIYHTYVPTGVIEIDL